MKHHFPILIASCLFAAVAAAPASAQSLLDLDANGDKAITTAEAQSALETQFKALDRNGDGVIDNKEYIDARLEQLSQFDANGDGTIDRTELTSHMRSRFRDR